MTVAKITHIYCINRISFELYAKKSSKTTVYHFFYNHIFRKNKFIRIAFFDSGIGDSILREAGMKHEGAFSLLC
jgi:hypothetical protein